jgi:hypothetical protein
MRLPIKFINEDVLIKINNIDVVALINQFNGNKTTLR